MSDSPSDDQSLEMPVEDWIDGDAHDEPVSSQGRGPQDTAAAQQLVMHSLLTGHFESAQSRENRIQLTMEAFDQVSTETHSDAPSVVPVRETSNLRKKLVFVATSAATVLVAFGLWGLLTPRSAEAALNRVIAATQVPVTRVYDATIRRRVLRRDVDRKATLYSRSIDRFAADFHSTRLQKSLWIGFDGEQRWFVNEDRHWSSAEDVELPHDALIDLVTWKNMQFNALLTRIPKAFHVELLPEQTVSVDGRSFDCQPLEATLRNTARGLPDIIRIWPHPNTGVVLQMHVINSDAGPLGVRLIELQLSGEEEVSDDFFSLEYHQQNHSPKAPE